MSFRFNGSNAYLNYSAAMLSSSPFTMACWFNSDTDAATQTLMSIVYSGNGVGYTLSAAGAVAGDPVTFASGAYAAVSSAGYGAGVWHHACGIEYAANSRAAFLDGGNKGTEATSNTPSSLNRTRIGVKGGSPVQYTNGMVAEAALWDAALTDEEVAVLAKGYSPLLVRPQSLVGYWPLLQYADPVVNLVGAGAMAFVNTPTKDDHPRVLRPSSQILRVKGGGGAPPVVSHARSWAVMIGW